MGMFHASVIDQMSPHTQSSSITMSSLRINTHYITSQPDVHHHHTHDPTFDHNQSSNSSQAPSDDGRPKLAQTLLARINGGKAHPDSTRSSHVDLDDFLFDDDGCYNEVGGSAFMLWRVESSCVVLCRVV
jgi:hypothetical protein